MYAYKLDKTVDRFPFQTLENTDVIPNYTWTLVGVKDNYAIIVCSHSLEYGETIDTISGYKNVKTNNALSKKEIIAAAYSPDKENMILRDKFAGRNTEAFDLYDSFVESIPAN